jgi:hypothetical protein
MVESIWWGQAALAATHERSGRGKVHGAGLGAACVQLGKRAGGWAYAQAAAGARAGLAARVWARWASGARHARRSAGRVGRALGGPRGGGWALAAWAAQEKAELGLGEKEGGAGGSWAGEAGPPGKRGGAEGVFLLFISFPFFFLFLKTCFSFESKFKHVS